MKTWIRSFGLAIAVARAKESGCTVGKVDMAAFEMLYGKGQTRIMHRIFNPSYLSVRARASNRLSFPTSLCT